MRALLFIAVASLAGCAGRPPAQVSDWDLCDYTMNGGNDAMVAQREASRRNLDCAPYYPMILAKRRGDAQALQDAAKYFNRRAQPAPAISPPVSCRSYRVGNQVQTDCN